MTRTKDRIEGIRKGSREAGSMEIPERASEKNFAPKKKKKKPTHLERLAECNISEELRVSIALALKKLESSDEQKAELELPSSLTSEERKYIHIVAQQMGFKSKSRGTGCNRYLTVYKKERSTIVSREAVLSLCMGSLTAVTDLLQRHPLTPRERQDLLPPTDRDRLLSADLRELGLLRSLGRLTPGPPQVPPGPGVSEASEEARRLPIWQQQHTIMQAMAQHQVILVCGETGSGKTTQVPQMILNQATSQCRPVRILCTQPRRISALTIAERVAQERGEKLGYTVGYQIRLESKLCPKTLLTFCTNGVLLRTLMAGESALATITHVLVDEVHERDRFTDFLLTVLKDCLPKFQHLKLVLMSAAMDVSLYSGYFGTCPIINVPGRCFPVAEHFLEDVLKYTGYSTSAMVAAQRKADQRQASTSGADPVNWTFKLEGQVTSSAVGGAAVHTSDKVAAAPGSRTDNATDGEKVLQASGGGRDAADQDVLVEDEEGGCNPDMDTVLQEAYLTGSDDSFAQMLYLIMSEGVSPDYQHTETMASALMVCAGRGRVAVMEQLLALGATLALRSSNGKTALAWARETEQQEALDLLQCYGASEGVDFEEESISAEPPTSAQSSSAPSQQQAPQSAAPRTVSAQPAPPSEPLSAQDEKRLQAYLMTASDELADVDLICSLCYKVHSSEPAGAMLVFLPGYDSITLVRDRIQGEEERYQRGGGRIALYCLHSSMPSVDQKRVFKPAPSGIRKIILATNIAETSVTINDVVYVINSGKIKEVSYDNLSGASCLKEVWASQASALQRRGRAGRCQPGVAYHLFSRTRYAALPPYQTPEILRVPLQEMCLHTKLLAPANVPIADFLTRAPEPPSLMVVRSAVNLLKSMEAIDGWEEVTALGHHLLELPLSPRLGKMVLVATILKCLDPVLTLAACLAHKDPFVLPKEPRERFNCNEVKKSLAAGSCSDHMVLIRVFQQWQKAHADGWERKWCARNYVSGAAMEMILGIRSQVLTQLRGMGFVKARGPQGDIRDCNVNSDNWGMVKAAIVSGMYPNLIRVDREQSTLRTQKQSQVRLHTSCSLYDLCNPDSRAGGGAGMPSMNRLAKKEVIKALPTDWLVFEEMVMTGMFATARTVTGVSPITVLLMAGPTHLPLHAISTSVTDDGSNSESEDQPLSSYGRLKLDDWVQFVDTPDFLQAAIQLRHKLHTIMLRRFKAPSKGVSQGDDEVIKAVATVLAKEEAKIGLTTPLGVGQRPMSNIGSDSPSWRDGGPSPHSGHSHRSSPAPQGSPAASSWQPALSQTFTNTLNKNSSKNTPKQSSNNKNNNNHQQANTKATLSLPGNKNASGGGLNVQAGTSKAGQSPAKSSGASGGKNTNASRTGDDSGKGSSPGGGQKAAGAPAGANKAEGKGPTQGGASSSVASQAKKDPVVEQIANSLKNLATGGTKGSGKDNKGAEGKSASTQASKGRGSRFFMVRPSGYRQLESALHSNLWTFSDNTFENRVMQAAQACSVVLVFGHGMGPQLHACARLGRRTGREDRPQYQVEWLSRAVLPAHATRALTNAFNDNQQVQHTKAGQEIDSDCGEQLLEVWQRHGSAGSQHRNQHQQGGGGGGGFHHNQHYHHGGAAQAHHAMAGAQGHHPNAAHLGGAAGAGGGGGATAGGGGGGGYNQRYHRGGNYGGFGGGYRGGYRGGGGFRR